MSNIWRLFSSSPSSSWLQMSFWASLARRVWKLKQMISEPFGVRFVRSLVEPSVGRTNNDSQYGWYTAENLIRCFKEVSWPTDAYITINKMPTTKKSSSHSRFFFFQQREFEPKVSLAATKRFSELLGSFRVLFHMGKKRLSLQMQANEL